MPSALLWEERLQRTPSLPRATKQLGKSQQLSPPCCLSSSITPALFGGSTPSACAEGMAPAGEGLQSPPFLGNCCFPAVRGTRASLTDVVSHLGFPICYTESSQHPCASLSRQLPTAPSLKLHFQRGSHMFGLWVIRGVLLSSQPLNHVPFHLLVLFSLTLGLC